MHKLVTLLATLSMGLTVQSSIADAQGAQRECAIEKYKELDLGKRIGLEEDSVKVVASFNGEVKCSGSARLSDKLKHLALRFDSAGQLSEDREVSDCAKGEYLKLWLLGGLTISYRVTASNDVRIIGASGVFGIPAKDSAGNDLSSAILSGELLRRLMIYEKLDQKSDDQLASILKECRLDTLL